MVKSPAAVRNALDRRTDISHYEFPPQDSLDLIRELASVRIMLCDMKLAVRMMICHMKLAVRIECSDNNQERESQ